MVVVLSSAVIGSGGDKHDVPTEKCPGVSAAGMAGFVESGQSGLELRHASIFAASVETSSNVNVESPMALTKRFLKLLTADPHNPPKCGALGDMKVHVVC